MRLFFGLAKDNTDFRIVKEIGFSGVLLDMTANLKKNILAADREGLAVWVKVNETEKKEITCIENIGGRATETNGEIYVVTEKFLDNMCSLIGDVSFSQIEGFVVPVPEFSGTLWNDTIEKECEKYGYDIYDGRMELFDEEKIESTFRAHYYEAVEKYVLSKYLIPVKTWASTLGKKVSFNIGTMQTQYDLAVKMINPFRLAEEGLSVAVTKSVGNDFETAAMLNSFGKESENLFLSDGGDCDIFSASIIVSSSPFRCDNKNCDADILLVKPSRGVMERYIWKRSKSVRVESPALIAAMDAMYYTDMLYEKGIGFTSTDEFGIEKYGDSKKGFFVFKGKKYNQVLICDSCRFSDKGIKILSKAEKDGVLINDKTLTDAILEDWEE